MGRSEAWKLMRWKTGHGETPGMRRAAVSFLKKHL